LDPPSHAETLYEAAIAPGSDERFRYMAEQPPASRDVFDHWASQAAGSADPLFFAVVDKQTQRAEGRQALMRIDASNGVIEVGHIVWGPRMTRTRIATEAMFLFAEHVFGLGYRRLEWKCNNGNEPSKKAAARFGFTYEGLFRQHMVVNRDTAWFSILDADWPPLHETYARWLDPENFDDDGRQKTPLITPVRA
jgi:RimJ/RimL family protein N-acetyltransferase